MPRRLLLPLLLVLVGFSFGPLVPVASACPMCQVATEEAEDRNLPAAMMYSILFMLAVPASIVSGLGIGLYRMSRRENEALLPSEQRRESESWPVCAQPLVASIVFPAEFVRVEVAVDREPH